MNIFLAPFLFMLLLCNTAFASTSWYHNQFEKAELEKKYKQIGQSISLEKFKTIFSRKNLSCDGQIFRYFERLDIKDIKFAILYATELELINDVETEILYNQASFLEKLPSKKSDLIVSLSKGENTIKKFYTKLKDKDQCIESTWASFTDVVVNKSNGNNSDVYSALNLKAKKSKIINTYEYYLLELMANEAKEKKLTIKDYRKKKEMLENLGNSLNENVTSFHLENMTKKTNSLRYRLYNNFSLQQQSEMLSLITRLKNRTDMEQSNIIFMDENGEISEKVSLNPLEQLHLSLKLYSKEKTKLMSSEIFASKSFTYLDLITVAYETSLIDEYQVEALLSLQKKVSEKTFIQKSFTYAQRLDFLVAAITGPVGGFAYSLSVGIVNNVINKDKEKATYDHDIFYGSCEMRL